MRGRGVFGLDTPSKGEKSKIIYTEYTDAKPRQGGFTVNTPTS